MNALGIQVAESREIVWNKGWQLVDQYIESESGTSVHRRSEYQRLLQDMETDKFDIVVIKSIDRLMRSAKDWYIFLDRLTRNKKQLYIYIDHKFYTPDDSLLTGIKAILAEDFSRELSKKIKNAHRRRQTKKTGMNITVPMFGWDKVGKDKYVLNEEEAEAYRLAFALAKEGKGFYTIANILYENGVRSKNGIRISDAQWRKMLYSPRAHGTVTLHTTEYDFEIKKKRKVPEKEWIYIENALPPIVSKAYQMEVLEEILGRTTSCSFHDYTRNMTAVGRYALSGKIYCGVCGSVYYRSTFASGDHILTEWKCSKALKQGRNSCRNRNVIEDVVLEKMEETCKERYEVLFGQDKSIVEEALFILRRVLGEKSDRLQQTKLEKEFVKLEKKKKILWDKLLDEVIEDGDFKKANQELTDKINQLQRKLKDIKNRTKEYTGYEGRLCNIRDALNTGLVDKAKTKELITRIDKIRIHPDGRLEILFERLKMVSLMKIYTGFFEEEDVDDSFFRIVIPYEHKNHVVRKREKVNNEMLKIFREKPDTMLKEVSAMIGVSSSYVNTSVKELKEKGLLRYERNGNTHRGRWIVTE